MNPDDAPTLQAAPADAPAPWHALTAEEALARLDSRADGLAPEEAETRLRRAGPNRLPKPPRRSNLRRFAGQFRNTLIYVLIASGAIALALGEAVDAAVILAVVVLNAVVGYVQEGRAEQALSAIRSMIDPTASVIRAGRRLSVPADTVAPGDVVTLEAGDRVPADLRLIRARSLRIDEAALTGESVPADKETRPVAADAALGDRGSMAFSGAFVAAGSGAGVAVATGGRTELGRIGAMIAETPSHATPLVRQMDHFAKQVTAAVLGGSALVLLWAFLVDGYAFADAFMVVVGLAVAAIPEGLPAVMTIALAVGVRRMASRNAIIRRLPAVETLGSVSVICSDKTGTLTRNEMTVAAAVTAEARYEIGGAGYGPEGEVRREDAAADLTADRGLAGLLEAAALCNDAHLRERDGRWTVEGDPMEGALAAFAAKGGLVAAEARAARPRLDEVPFDSRHRYMATLNAGGEGPVALVKGAPEAVLAMCRAEAAGEGERPLDLALWRDRVEAMARDGLRVLALARQTGPDAWPELGGRLVLLGLVGLIDPPRAEALAAVAECRAAGIRVKMITGDHVATARAIAVSLGLAENPKALIGAELDALDAEGFLSAAREATVFARTTPEHKLRLVEALQSDGSVIAMTGDGVNDAPALKRADIGVAMGRKGTEAAKQAADMVLADDNFASIVAAVREGRTVRDNLVKVIAWTLPTNGGEATTIILAILFGLALPVTPVQILWINMVTAVALGLTLAFEPTEPNAMRRAVRRAGESLMSRRLVWRIGFVSALMAAGVFGVYFWALGRGLPVETARTLVVNAIVAMEVGYLFSVRYVHGTSLTLTGALGTPAVAIGVGAVAVAQLAFTYAPPLNALFGTHPLAPGELAVAIAAGAALLVCAELEKRAAAAWPVAGRAGPYVAPAGAPPRS